MGIIRTADRSPNSREVGFTLRSSGVLKQPGPAPLYYTAGGTFATAGDLNYSWPNPHQQGDLGILILETGGDDTTLTPAGWQHVAGSPVVDISDATGSKLHVLWRFAESDAEDAVTATDPGDHIIGRMYTFRGVRRDVAPGRFSSTDTKTTASTSATYPSITTPYDNCLVVMVASDPSDTSSNTFTALTNANLSSLAELNEYHSTTGHGGGFSIATGIKEISGSTGTTSVTMLTSITNALITFALEPSMALLP